MSAVGVFAASVEVKAAREREVVEPKSLKSLDWTRWLLLFSAEDNQHAFDGSIDQLPFESGVYEIGCSQLQEALPNQLVPIIVLHVGFSPKLRKVCSQKFRANLMCTW
jgi:hypothetical protein